MSAKTYEEQLIIAASAVSLWSYMRLYRNRLPGDIGLPRRTAQAHAAMFRRQWFLLCFFILLKYAYPKELWLKECKKHGFAQGSRNLSVQKCVSEFMLVVALRDIDNLSHMAEAPGSGNPYRSDRSGVGGDTARRSDSHERSTRQ